MRITKYFIGENKELLKLDYYIDEGEEGCIYRSGKEAIKIYWESWKKSSHGYLKLEDVLPMTKLNSDHILLPRRPVYNSNDEFCGYSTKHIDGYYGDKEFVLNYHKEIKVLKNMSLSKFEKIISKVYEEMYYLSYNRIILSDLTENSSNYIFNGEFWLIDPGCYIFSDNEKNQIIEENIYQLNKFFLVFGLGIYDEKIIEIMKNRGSQYTVCNFVKEEGKILEKILSFRQKMTSVSKIN